MLNTKPMHCICQECECTIECTYFAETIKPVIQVVEANLNEMSDPFVRALDEALENFTCEYKE